MTAGAGAVIVLRCELVKIAALRRAQATLLVSLLGPFAVVAVLDGQANVPKDTLFGRYVHDSGFAVPLLILGFAGQWLLPALVSLVAGDVFAGEDHLGTWKSILTRSCSRAQIFWGKAMAVALWALISTGALALGSILAGLLLVGSQPLVGLSGQTISAGNATGLVLAAWLSVLPPVLGFTGLSLLSSAVGRSTIAGIAAPPVLGLIMQLTTVLTGAVVIQTGLLTTSFVTWHALFTTPATAGPIVSGVLVSAVWAALGLAGAYLVMTRREFRA
jgi:ABC-2 type transport system permease protein